VALIAGESRTMWISGGCPEANQEEQQESAQRLHKASHDRPHKTELVNKK